MANYSPLGARLNMKLNTGEYKDGKQVFKNIWLDDIDSAVAHDDLAEIAGGLASLLEYPADEVVLARRDLVTI